MAYLFIRRQGISSHLQTIWGARVFHPVALLKLMFVSTWDGCLRESLDCCKGCQDTSCVWCGMRDGYGFNEGEMCFILCWFGVDQSILRSWGDISVLLVCDSLVGDSLEFNQANWGSLCAWLGKRNCSACNAVESGLISFRGGSLMGFLELRQARGVYSRVTRWMPILNGSLFSEVRTLV